MFTLKDFFFSYPSYYLNDYDLLNPYNTPMYETLASLKEFTPLEEIEQKPSRSGIPLTHQRNIAHFLSPLTDFDRLLLIHGLGSGKTCTAIQVCELAMKLRPDLNKPIIISGNESLIEDFKEQLAKTCTYNKYLPDDWEYLTEGKYITRRNKLINQKYEFHTRATFASNYLEPITDEEVIRVYSNRVIVIDEAHHLRIQPVRKLKKGLVQTNVYKEFYRFLHLIQNCKVILLTGTPMQDNPKEIASLMNLILPKKELLPFAEFKETFFDKNNNLINVNRLYKAFHGRISYLRKMEESKNVTIIYEPSQNTINEYKEKGIILDPYPEIPKTQESEKSKMEKIKVMALPMKPFQKHIYIQAYKSDKKSDKKESSKAFYDNSKQAAMFVFPDDINYITDPNNASGTYGSKGFKKYFIKNKDKYKMKKSLKKLLLYGSDDKKNKEEIILNNIKQCGIKIGETIEMILQRKDQFSFVFSELVQGSGTILFASLLELFDYKEYNDDISKKEYRYIFVKGETNKTEIRNNIKFFNSKENFEHKYITVIIGSTVLSEGYSFYNINNCFILTPHWNNAETEQAIGRTNRAFSHSPNLPLKELHIYRLAVDSPKNSNSIDLIMYKRSLDKEKLIMQIMRILKESAFDCILNRKRNIKATDKPGSRECDYSDNCNYECKECTYYNKNEEKKYLGLEEAVDFFKKIEKTKWQCKSVKLPVAKYDTNYNLYFAENEIESIKEKIKQLYKIKFVYELNQLVSYFNTSFIILIRALKELIDDSIPIKDKYGFTCYLRQNNNLYFLVDNITYTNDYNMIYYVQHPATKEQYSFNIILNQIKIKYLSDTLKFISSLDLPRDLDEQKEYIEIIKNEILMLPLQIKELFLEQAILAREQLSKWSKKKKDKYKELVDAINNIFMPYYIEDKKRNYYISRLFYLEGKNELRCFDKQDKNWFECDNLLDEYKQLEKKKELKVKEKTKSLAEEVHKTIKYYGVIFNNKFHIRDVTTKQHFIGRPSVNNPNKIVGLKSKPKGRACSSIKRPELIIICMLVGLKGDKKEKRDKLISSLKSSKDYSNIVEGLQTYNKKQLDSNEDKFLAIKKEDFKDMKKDELSEKINDIDLKYLSDEQLNSLKYAISINNKTLCSVLEKFFESNDIIDIVNG